MDLKSSNALMKMFTEELDAKRIHKTNDMFFEIMKEVYSEKRCEELLDDFIKKCEIAVKNATILKEDLIARKAGK